MRFGAAMACLGTAALAGAARFDLEVGVPPGSPIEWGRAFPAITPGGGPLFPVTPMPGADPKPERRSEARPRTIDMDLRLGSSFGLVRILTWDLTAEIDWLRGVTQLPPPTGAAALGPRLPRAGEPLYWITLAPLLRLLLHPAAVSRHETALHLLEIGEPVLPALEAARNESALRATCSMLEGHIDLARARTIEPLEARGPREAMLSRFVLEELVAAHPYDPAGGFGRRLFALSEELEPLVAAYLDHDDPFTARNAAAALGRYRTRFAYERLLRAALTTDDRVVFARALAALPDQDGARSAGPLVQQLENARDDLERVALIGVVGRLGAADAVPALLAMGERQFGDPDVLLAVVTALARIPYCDQTAEVTAFARKLEDHARRNPQGFRPKAAAPANSPDSPDPPTRRGELLMQLAMLARFRHDATDPALDEALLALARAGGPAMVGGSARLGRVLPPAQMLYLDALARLGEEGQGVLIELVESGNEDASLRGRALAQLPWSERKERAPALLAAADTDGELKIHALEIMAADRHPQLVPRARVLLTEGRLRGPGSGAAMERHLQLVALRALRDTGRLSVADLLPLLDHPRADRQRLEDLRGTVEARVRALVAQRAARKPMATVRKGIEALLDLLEELGVTRHLEGRVVEQEGHDTRRLDDRSREAVVKHIERTLEGMQRGNKRPGYEVAVTDSLMEYLLGYVARAQPGVLAPLEPPVPFEQEILFALGRTRAVDAVNALVELLEDRANGYRAFACLAIGMTEHPWAAVHLVPLLQDEDPFVRYCAYEGLRHLSGEDHFADWMYGEPAARAAAMQEYARWCRERR